MTDQGQTHFYGDGCTPPHGCSRCGKPFAPYGVAISTEHADEYCWSDHEIRDLKEAVIRLRAFCEPLVSIGSGDDVELGQSLAAREVLSLLVVPDTGEPL